MPYASSREVPQRLCQLCRLQIFADLGQPCLGSLTRGIGKYLLCPCLSLSDEDACKSRKELLFSTRNVGEWRRVREARRLLIELRKPVVHRPKGCGLKLDTETIAWNSHRALVIWPCGGGAAGTIRSSCTIREIDAAGVEILTTFIESGGGRALLDRTSSLVP